MNDLDVSKDLHAAKAEGSEGHEAALRRRRLAARMFGVVEDEPVRFGRFVLMEQLGAGGVGAVHVAYDPQLDRRVALKLLRTLTRTSTLARQRMLREAQMLARLSHPNVVPVYEAGMLDEQVFIAMEFIPGSDLARWLEDERPDWATALEVYMQAGRGLAAAHALGIVHRDFKPANVLLGEDGRVRVVDFGLARAPVAAQGSPLRPPPGRDIEGRHADTVETTASLDPRDCPSLIDDRAEALLTAPGAVMGTPAYMAPEQFVGADVGPAADQYAFCAALHEALYRRRPVVGDSFENIREAALSGALSEPEGRDVPRWLWPIIRRGLARDPAARFPTMDALLTELGRDRQRSRRRALGVLAALALSLGSAGLAWQLSAPEQAPRCRSVTPLLAPSWSPERRAAVEASLRATGRSYAEEVAPRVLAELDAYAEAWATMQREACELHALGIESDLTHELRGACLDTSKRALASTVAALEGIDAAHLPEAVELVEALPRLDVCADLEALTTKVAPPDPEIAAAVADERLELIDLSTLRVAGRDQQALAGLDASLSRARALAYEPLIAEVLLALGRAQLDTNRFPEAAASLREAAMLSFEFGHDALGLEALARLINAESHLGAEQTRASLAYLPFAEALSRRHPRAEFARALLLNNAGTAHLAAGEREQAKQRFRAALDHVEQAGLDQPELSFVALNLASVSDDPATRRALSRRAVAEFEAKLGTGHPKTLRARYLHTHNLDDAAAAERERAPVCQRLVRDHPEEAILSTECFYTLAYLRDELGDRKGASAAFERALELAGEDPSSAMLRAVIEGYLALERGEIGLARARFEDTLAGTEGDQAPWWLSRELGRTWLGLARVEAELGAADAQLRALEQGVAHLQVVVANSRDADLRRAEAGARAELAQLRARLAP